MDYKEVLEQIKPSQEDDQKIQETIKEITSLIEEQAKKQLIKIEITPGGSTAKGTYLKGSFDVDIFVRFIDFKKDYSDALELLLKDIENLERVHGSRDYFNFTYNNLHFEIVPVKYVDSKEEVENVTDMSPLHVKWIQEHLNQNLQDDIRLAKQFCKAALVYGAESYINGVSGHVLDILLVHYKSFDNFIKEVASWDELTVIDINKVHDDVFAELNQAKLNSPLIVIDPVDSGRNAAAALSKEKYDLLIQTTKEFSKNPSAKFFTIPKFNKEKLKEGKDQSNHLVILEIAPNKGKDDVVITKIFKVFEFIQRHLTLHDFSIQEANWHPGKPSYLYFYLDNKELEETYERAGPPLSRTEDCHKFKEAHPDAYEKDGRLHANIKREFTKPLDCIDHLLNQSYVQERIASLEREVF